MNRPIPISVLKKLLVLKDRSVEIDGNRGKFVDGNVVYTFQIDADGEIILSSINALQNP
jgi:hypothetical protein